MLKGQPLGNSCAGAVWPQEEGREEGQWGRTLSQATQRAKLGPDPDSGGPLPSLGTERRLSGSASFKVKTKWIRSGCDISFEGEISFVSGV